MDNLNISTDVLLTVDGGLPSELHGLNSFQHLLPYAFPHEGMDRANGEVDDTLLNMLSGINSQERLAILTGIEWLQDGSVSLNLNHASDCLRPETLHVTETAH